jgi:hypothetical protein
VPSLDHSSGAPGLTDLPSIAERPLVSVEGWARFEARARNRRIERRLEAARAAIKARRFDEARAALAELHEIDASLPILPELAAQLAVAEQPSAKRPIVIGPYLAAAATFAALMMAASWLNDESLRPLHSFPIAQMTAAAPMVETSLPSDAAALSADFVLDTPAATSGEIAGAIDATTPVVPVVAPSPDRVVPQTAEALGRRAPDAVVPRASDTVVPRAVDPVAPRVAETVAPRAAGAIAEPPPAVARELQPPPGAIVERTWEPPPSPPVRAVEALSSPPAAASSAASGAAVAAAPAPARAPAEVPRTVEVDETRLVRDVLSRYQAAYDRLDAGLAHDVWPTVNQAALARAFGDLESQSITVNNCDVSLRADTAAATCKGLARYTPKVGSRQARVESRVWNFTLRKQARGGLIETARAER